MKTMNHKGYDAKVEFDAKDRIFVGGAIGLKVAGRFHG
jgi:predicted HicB family RNase H-like nuclease